MRKSPFRWAAALAAVALVCACKPAGPQPSDTEVGQTLPLPIVQGIGSDLGSPTFANLSLRVGGKFEVGGRKFTVLESPHGRMDPPIEQIESAASNLADLAGTKYVLPLKVGKKTVKQSYKAQLAHEPEGLVVFIGSLNSFLKVKHELGGGRDPVAFTVSRSDGRGHYAISFIPPADGANGTYTELCQNLMRMKPIFSISSVVSDHKKAEDFGQESLCNTMGDAMAYARHGYPHGVFLVFLQRAASIGIVAGDLPIVEIDIDDSLYKKFAKDGDNAYRSESSKKKHRK